ncbi:MAG: rhodanese-like domain-containing protein [Oceanospirillaceae bacterium]|nr:rhodanese-like domain-containing protein [Oceanospirillaceae bacterium]
MTSRIRHLDAAAFAQLSAQQPCTVVDVRSGAEYRSERLPNTVHIPLQELPDAGNRLEPVTPGDTLYLLCQSGKRAASAAQALSQQQHCELVVIEGGLNALKQQGVKLERSKAGLSLERQVRIAAGALVLLGVLLGSLVHPAGFALSAFVGAGLMFAGITDWCGMALLLARMPWNR